MRVQTVHPEDLTYVRSAAEMVFGAYTGGLKRWALEDSSSLWKIHFGMRAGVVGVELEGRRCCVKLFYDNRLFVGFRNRIGFAKAKRAYLKGLELKRRGVSCPEMLGYAVCRKSGLALLVTELAEGFGRVDQWIEQHGADTVLLEALADFVVQMHAAGVAHKDLSPRNVLVKDPVTGNEFIILDYEDASFHRKVPDNIQLKDIRHMHERLLRVARAEDVAPFMTACGLEAQ